MLSALHRHAQPAQTVNGDIGSMVSVADTISGTPGTAITYKDCNDDGRDWAARADQTGYE